jgi:hypothetical protein
VGGRVLRSVSSFLVDDRGNVHLGRAAHQVAPVAEDDVAMAAVKDGGQIEWFVREGHVRVRLRPSMVSPAAFARVLAWLASRGPERVLLSSFIGKEWHYEYLRSSSGAGERVRELVERHGGGRSCNLRRRACSGLAFPDSLFDQAVGFWRDHRDSFEPDLSMRVLGPLLDGKWLLYERLSNGGFAVAGFGPCHTDHVRKWLETHREPLHLQGGESFVSRACAQVYRDVANAFEPSADELDAVSHWTGFGRLRSSYRRVMLPFRSGERGWVVSGIRLDASIDLLE